ncbi:MAG: mucoidy inhibitor MuiA family protein [Bacteroidota bacterium]|nr:mucoidy inhibitor MuiA family protein [Bacteroidota bacterium]
MKNSNIYIILLFLLGVTQLKAQEGNHVKSKITNATVYISGALITRECELSLEKGENYFIIENLPLSMNDASMQLKGLGSIQVLSMSVKQNYLNSGEDKPKRLNEMADSIEYLQLLIDQLSNQKKVLDEDLNLLLNNKNINEKGSDVSTLEELHALYKKRIYTIKDELLKIKMQRKKFIDKQIIIQRQGDQMINDYSTAQKEVHLKLYSENKKTLKLNLVYLVYGVSWYASYDVRVKDLKSPMQLTYKANITQTTGEDWNNVILKISNGNPSLGNSRPVLNPVYTAYTFDRRNDAEEETNSFRGNVMVHKKENALNGRKHSSEGMVMSSNVFNIEFNIAIPYSILADGKVNTVDAQVFEMPAVYELSAVPKLDQQTYLIGRISGNEELGQLNGRANVYFDGTFVGQSNVSSDENDTLNISLGVDKSILVERKKLRESSKKAFLGSTKKETNTFEISVRNTKNIAQDIIIEDNIPVSTDKQVEITLEESSGATINADEGKLTWHLTLQPGEIKKLKISYTVKSPKNKVIYYNKE